MKSALSYMFDLVLLVLILGLFCVNLPALSKYWGSSLVQTREDKTALDSEGGIYITGYDEVTVIERDHKMYLNTVPKTGRDLLLSLIVMDFNTPYPRAVRINKTPVIKLDNNFITNKYSEIGKIYSTSGEHKLGAMLDYRIISLEYVYTGPDAPYWQFELER